MPGNIEKQGLLFPLLHPRIPLSQKNVALCLSMDLSYLCLFNDLNIEPNEKPSENPLKALQHAHDLVVMYPLCPLVSHSSDYPNQF